MSARRPAGRVKPSAAAIMLASLVAQAEAIRRGCDQVVFLDAIERRWVEELGGMNVFFLSKTAPFRRRRSTERSCTV